MGGSQGPRLNYRYRKCAWKQASKLQALGHWYAVMEGGSGYWCLVPMTQKEIDLCKYNTSITQLIRQVYGEAVKEELDKSCRLFTYLSART